MFTATRQRRYRNERRGIALMDVIVGGIMLGIGMTVTMSLASRALTRQTQGEKRLVASWLADELLNMVLVEGPDKYARRHDTNDRFDAPFDDFVYDVDLNDQGQNEPFRVTVKIAWPAGSPRDQITIESLISVRRGDPFEPRAPLEEVDRLERYLGESDDDEG